MNNDLVVEITKDSTVQFTISGWSVDDYGLFEAECRDLFTYLDNLDSGLDGNGGFSELVESALIDVIEDDKLVELVLTDSEYSDVIIQIRRG